MFVMTTVEDRDTSLGPHFYWGLAEARYIAGVSRNKRDARVDFGTKVTLRVSGGRLLSLAPRKCAAG